MSSWLVFMGTRDEAKKYDAETVLSNDEGAWSGMRGPVYSIEVGQEELLEDRWGILKLNMRRIGNVCKIVGDQLEINLDFKVTIPK